MRISLLCAVLAGCGSVSGTVELGDGGICIGDCDDLSAELLSADRLDSGIPEPVTLLGLSDYRNNSAEPPPMILPDGGPPPLKLSDGGSVVTPDSSVPREVDTGPELALLCEPCDVEADCEDGFTCADFGVAGHEPSEGQGGYCLPSCTSYFSKSQNTECTAVFSDHQCLLSFPACRPTGYSAAGGVADDCDAWWGI